MRTVSKAVYEIVGNWFFDLYNYSVSSQAVDHI